MKSLVKKTPQCGKAGRAASFGLVLGLASLLGATPSAQGRIAGRDMQGRLFNAEVQLTNPVHPGELRSTRNSQTVRPGVPITAPIRPAIQPMPFGIGAQEDRFALQNDNAAAPRLQLAVAAKNSEAVQNARVFEYIDFDVPYAFRFTKNDYPSLPQLDDTAFGGESLRSLSINSPYTPPAGSQPAFDDLFRPQQTPLRAHISGRLDVQGYLAIIGIGQARAEVYVSLLDVGPVGSTQADNEHFGLHRLQVLEREISTSYEPRLGMSWQLKGGSDFEGGGTGIHADYQVPLRQLNIVQNDLDWGFDVMLQRGRRYRIEISLLGEAGLHTPGLGLGDAGNDDAHPLNQARAIASFYDVAPGPLDPFRFDFSDFHMAERWKNIWEPIDTYYHKLENIVFFAGPPTPFFPDINSMVDYLFDDYTLIPGVLEGAPNIVDSSLDAFANGLDGLARYHLPDANTTKPQFNPAINPPFYGVNTDYVSVILEHDQVDFLDKFERREIECLVDANLPDINNLKTPMLRPFNAGGVPGQDPWNGRFDLAYDTVIQVANGAWPFLNDADKTMVINNLIQARADALDPDGNGPLFPDYDQAFRNLHDAYQFILP